MSTNSSDDGYTPIWVFSSWAEHWFTGVACAIFANILIFYLTRIYGRRLAIERVLMQKQKRRIRREDSFYSMNEDDAVTPLAGQGVGTPQAIDEAVAPLHSGVLQKSGPVESASLDGQRRPPPRHQSAPSMPTLNQLNLGNTVDGGTGATSTVTSFSSSNVQTVPHTSISSPVLRNRSESHPATLPHSSAGRAPPGSLQPQNSSSLKPTLPPIEEEVKVSDLIRVAVLALLIQAFLFAALSIVSLALVTPLTCLFFVWWRVATLETARSKIRKEMSNPHSYSIILYFASLRRALTLRFWSIVGVLVVANSLVVAAGPHDMYVVAVHKVVTLDTPLMIYITIVVVIIVFQGVLHSSQNIMESLSRCFGLKKTTDLEPLLLGANAGLLGGQYLLLVKLLAEITEAALLLPKEKPPVEQTYLIVLFAFVVGIFHVYAWRRGMGTSRTKLFIPVYRFWFVISGMVASLLCLREFFNSSPAEIVLYFIGVFLDLALLFIMARNALHAVKRDDFSTVIFLEEDPEQGIEMRSGRNRGGGNRQSRAIKHGSKQRRDLLLPPALPGQPRSLSAPPATRLDRASSADSALSERTRRRGHSGRRTPRGSSFMEHSELFHSAISPMSTTLTPGGAMGGGGFHSNEPSFMRRSYTRRESVDSTFARRSYSRERKGSRSGSRYSHDDSGDSDGYESVGSFHSEPAESMIHEFQPISKQVEINYEYTSPDSMIVPKGQFNPWAPKNTSFYFDCAAVPGNFKVRGPTYLEDGEKVKCDVSRMKLVMGEWLPNPDHPIKNICNHPSHFIQREHVGRKDRPFLFVLNMMVPSVGNAVFTWCRRPNVEPDPVFEKMLDEFMNHPNDEFRHKQFKIIPGVPEGSFIAKKAVGNKPAMLCAKVPTTYHRGDNWFEVCVDCAQSRVAFSVMGAIKGFASGLTLQLGFLLESTTPQTLPECLLGGITVVKPQMTPEPQARENGAGGITGAVAAV